MPSSCYRLKIVTDFAAAHTLRNYDGPCSRMHGHNWKLEAEVTATALDEAGMVLDFKDVRQTAQAVIEKLDHQYLNDIEPFNRLNPTAENIAAYVFRGMAERLNNERIRVAAVTIWETERACVRYSEED